MVRVKPPKTMPWQLRICGLLTKRMIAGWEKGHQDAKERGQREHKPLPNALLT